MTLSREQRARLDLYAMGVDHQYLGPNNDEIAARKLFRSDISAALSECARAEQHDAQAAETIRAEEREACAKVAETGGVARCMNHEGSGRGVCGDDIARAIRARGGKP